MPKATLRRAQLIAWGLKPALIPRGGKFNQCGASGEGALCKRYPELIDCTGLGAAANMCRMVFVAPHGRFFVVAAHGWDRPRTMVYRAGSWADDADTKAISNILAGKPELAE
jgi:hypothetical protein